MFERFKKSGLSENWSFNHVTRLEGKSSILRKLRGETAVQPVGRIVFEPLEQRVLLSADINPVFGALAFDTALDAHLAVQEVGPSYITTTEAVEVDLHASAVPTGPSPEITAFDLTFLESGSGLAGTRVSTDLNFFALDEVTDSGTFTLNLQGGQTLSLVREDSGDLVSALTLLDPLGDVIASSTGPSGSIQSAAIASAGTYTVRVERLAGAGNALVTSVLNAGLEVEGLGGDTNDTIETAQSLDATAIVSANGGRQYAVIGDYAGDDSGRDVYSFAVTPGEMLSIFAGSLGSFYDLSNIRVLDADGQLIATENAYPVRIKAELFGCVVIEVQDMPAATCGAPFSRPRGGPGGWKCCSVAARLTPTRPKSKRRASRST